MKNEYTLYVGFENFLKDKVLDGLQKEGYEVLISENNNFMVSKIIDDNYDKDNEVYVSKIIMSLLKRSNLMTKKPFSVDISEKMEIWISKAKKNKKGIYSIPDNNYLHTLIRTTLTSIIINNEF